MKKLSIEQIFGLMKDGSLDIKEGLMILEDISGRMSIVAENLGGMVRSTRLLIERAEGLSKKIQD